MFASSFDGYDSSGKVVYKCIVESKGRRDSRAGILLSKAGGGRQEEVDGERHAVKSAWDLAWDYFNCPFVSGEIYLYGGSR